MSSAQAKYIILLQRLQSQGNYIQGIGVTLAAPLIPSINPVGDSLPFVLPKLDDVKIIIPKLDDVAVVSSATQTISPAPVSYPDAST